MAADQETRPWLSPDDMESHLQKPRRVMAPMLVLIGLPVGLILLLLGYFWLTGLVPWSG